MRTKALALILIIVLISFLGFITENLFIYFRKGFIDNRNMVLPFLLGYGISVFLIYKLFGTPDKPLFFGQEVIVKNGFIGFIYYFIIALLCVMVGELILGHLVEWICDIKWWDYSTIPFSITRYTSIPTSAVFSLLITVFMKYLFSPLMDIFTTKMNPRLLCVLALSLIVLLSVDFIHSGIYMLNHHKTLDIWKIDLGKPLKQMLIDMKGSS